jgi:hypothetical protein
LSQLGRTSLLEWLRTSAATTWQSLGPPQAERLTALLDAAGLGEDVTQQVAFHAGRR